MEIRASAHYLFCPLIPTSPGVEIESFGNTTYTIIILYVDIDTPIHVQALRHQLSSSKLSASNLSFYLRQTYALFF